MRRSRTSPAHGLPERDPASDLLGILGRFGEEVSARPDDLEGTMRRMVSEARDVLLLRGIGLHVAVGGLRRVRATAGVLDGDPAAELSILRGKIKIGTLSAWREDSGSLDEEQFRGLRAAAAFCSLTANAAYDRELAAERAAHGSMVQLASEALGTILDEGRLHKTVLVLTLELLGASGGVIFLDGDRTVSIGLEEAKESFESLRRVALPGRKPWVGRMGARHVLGVPVGRSGGSLFVFREERPYTEAEGVSLKLVARQLARAQERSRLYASLERTTVDAISALAAALESRDATTGGHIDRAQYLAEEVAEALGLDPDLGRTTRYAAVLHDIGKIGIADAILNKPGKLDKLEWEFMRRHPRIGADIVSRIEGFEGVSEAVLAHHERHDGRGYPAGLSGAAIPVGARVISVIDAYDAMTNDRPYRKALSRERALAELAAGSGSQFDPEVVEALKSVLSKREGEKE